MTYYSFILDTMQRPLKKYIPLFFFFFVKTHLQNSFTSDNTKTRPQNNYHLNETFNLTHFCSKIICTYSHSGFLFIDRMCVKIYI